MENKSVLIGNVPDSQAVGTQEVPKAASAEFGGVTPISAAAIPNPLNAQQLQSPAPSANQNGAPPPLPPKKPGFSFNFKKYGKIVIIAAILLLAIGGIVAVASNVNQRKNATAALANADRFNSQQISLSDLATGSNTPSLVGTRSLIINGPLTANDAFTISPSGQPSNANRGQIYFDQTSNLLAYYNGTQFVPLTASVQSLGGQTGIVTVGQGLSATNNQITNTGVLTLQGQTGNVTLTAGPGIAIDGTTISATGGGVSSIGGKSGAINLGAGLAIDNANNLKNAGIISATQGTGISVVNDGNGNITISTDGQPGTGTVTSPGGTIGRIAKFTGAQDISDSLISESGTTITVNGDLSVTSGLTLGTALSVGNGGTGTTALAANGVVIGNGAGALTAVTAAGPGLCFMSNAGAPSFQACPSSSSVTSLNGLAGALSVANASGAGSTITIDNASTAQKGIAQFNGTNFSDNGAGTINTIQNINSGATPTFAGVNTNSINPSGPLTVGSTTQPFTLQGNASSVINATSGVNSTTLAFQAPGANVTYRFATAVAGGTYDICTMVGNCAGIGGGVTTSGGTSGTLAVFTGAQAIGDSLVSQAGSTVAINGNLNLTSGHTYQINGTQISSTNLSNDANLAKLNGAQTFTGATNTFQNSADSALAFSIQNASSQRILSINTTAGSAIFGQGGALGAQLVLSNATNANTITLVPAVATGNRTITFPDDTGTVCLSTGNCAGVGVTLQSAYNNSTSPEVVLDSTRGALTIRDNATPLGANLLEVQNNAGSTTYFAVTSGGTSTTGTSTVSSTINTTGGTLQTNSVTRVDNSGNLTNIGNITGTGAVTIASSGAGNNVTIDGANQFIVQDATVVNSQATFNTDVDLTLADTENLNITNTVTGTNAVNLVAAVLTNNTTSGTQNLAFLQNAAGSGTTEGLLVLDNADPDTAVTNGLQITSAAGGVANAIDVSDPDIVTALLFGANDITGTNFSVTGATGSFTSAGNATLQGGVVTVGTTSQAGSLVLSDGSSNTATIAVAAQAGDRVYTLPDVGGNATFCLSTGNCSGTAVTLQSAYDNSSSPEIILDATRGALTLRDNATPLGANLFEVQNNSGATTYFDVTASGIAVTGTATASGNVNSTGGALQTNSVTRVDNSGNLTNIGNLTLSGAISGGTTYSGSGNINTTGGALQTAGTSRVDNTGNLVNIGNLTAAGAITIASSGAGNDVTIDGADQFIIQDAAVFNSTATFNTDVDLTLADTENLNITNTVTGTNAVNLVGAVLTNNTTSGTQQVALLQNASGSGTTEGLLVLDNADPDTAVTNGVQITSAAGGITTAIDVSDPDIVTALLFGANDITGTNFSVTGATGSFTSAGNATIQGGTVTAGTTSQQGSLVLHDGNGQTATLSVGSALGANTAIAIPTGVGPSDTVCLLTLANCVGTGGGVSGSGTNNTLAKFNGTGSTIGDSTISDNGTTVSTSVDLIVQGGDLTLGVANSQTGSVLFKHSGSAFTGTIVQGALTGDRTYTLPDAGGTICTSAGNCSGTGSSSTLQAAYDAGNTIATTDARDIAFTLANTTTDSNFTVTTATGSTSFVSFTRADGAGTADPAQLLLVKNNDVDRAQPVGISLQSAAGGLTTAIDASGSNITNALKVGANAITGTTGSITYTNFGINGATGDITTAGDFAVNGGDITSTGPLTLTSGGAGNIVLNSAATIELQDNTNVTGALAVTGNVNSSGGSLQTNGTTRVDNSGNLTNIGNLTLSGAISGGTTYSGTGNINTTGGGLQTNSTTRVDNSGNLTNIGNITGTGGITIASSGVGNDVTIDGADQFIVQDSAVFNGQGMFNTDVDLTLADTENLNITNTVTGTNSVDLIAAVLTNNTTSGTQNIAKLQNAAGSGTTDGILVLDNADTDTAVTNGIQITSAAGGVTTAIDVSDPDIGTALLFGANDITGTNFSVTGSNGNFTSAGSGTVQGGVVNLGTTSQAGSLVMSDGSSNTVTVAVAALAADRIYTLPDVGSNAFFCMSTGNCAGAGVTLQAAYNNSTSPEITLDATRGALTLRDNATPIGANLFEVQNNAGTSTYFKVDSAGIAVNGSLNVLSVKPATVSGAGTVGQLSQVIGGEGGDTTGTTGQQAGGGGSLFFLAGKGGDAPSGGLNGWGGTVFIAGGAPGAGAGTAGLRGNVILQGDGGPVGIGNYSPQYPLDVTGDINSSANIRTGGTARITSTGNLTNIGTIAANSDADFTLADTENVSITNTVTGTNSVDLLSGVLTNNSTSGTQRIGMLQNAAGTGTTESLLTLDNADTDTAVVAGLQITSAAGGITTAIDLTDADIVDAINVGANNIVGTTGNIDLTNFDVVGASGNITTAGDLAVNGGDITSTTSLTLASGGGSNIVLNSAGTIELQDNTNVTGALAATGNINSSGAGLQTNGTTRVDNTGNLTNIGNITGTGGVTIASSGAGNNVTIDGANQFIVQDATVFNGQATFNTDVDLTLADTENLSITNTVTGTNALNLISAILTNNTTSGTQNVAQLQNAAGSGTTEGLLVLDNTDTDTAVTGGLIVSSAAGGVTNAIDVSDPDIVTALLFGANDITGTNFSVTGSNGNLVSAGNATLQGGVVTVGTTSQAGTLVLSDGSSNTGTLQVASLATINRVYTLPDATGTICLDTGNCAGAGATLQTSYNNSTSPEIVLDATRGALTLRDNATPLGGNLFEVQNNGGGTTYFNVTASGIAVTGTATATGNINSSGGALQTNSTTRIDNSGNLTNINVVTLNGSQTKDVTTADAATATNLTFKPGTSTANDASGANTTLNGGDTSTGTCGTACNGGDVTIQGGAATNAAGVRNGGDIFVDGGTGTSANGTINIGTVNSSSITVGKTTGSSSTTIQTGSGNITLQSQGAGSILAKSDAASAFQVQTAGGVGVLTVDNTARSGSGGNLVKIGNSTGTDGATTILQLDAATADPTTNLAALNGGLFYNSTSNKISVIENGTVKVLCNATDLACGGGVNWDTIGDPSGNGAINFGQTVQTMDYTLTSANANLFSFNFTNNGGTAGTDSGLVLNNALSANTTGDLNTENLLLLQQLDTTASGTTVLDNAIKIDSAASSGITNGLQITNSAGNIQNGIDIVDTAGGTLTSGVLFDGTIGNDINTNGARNLTIGTNGTTRITVAGSGADVTLSTNTDLLLQGATAFISNPQAQTNSESFGLNAAVAGVDSLAVGNGATTHATGQSIAVGRLAAGGANAVTIGYNSSTDGNAVSIGHLSSATSDSVAIGESAGANNSAAIAIGRAATTTASNQIVIGSTTAFISNLYIGNGVSTTTGQSVTLQGTTSTGANGTGAAVTLKAGDESSTSCGTACIGGALTLQGGAASGASGTVRNGGAVVLDGGTGNSAVGAIQIGTNNDGTVTIGKSTGTATLTFGQSTATQIINIGNATVAAGNTETINIGTSSTSTGKTVVTIGSINDGSSLLLQSGTGHITLQAGGTGTSDTIQIGAGGTGSTTPDILALDVKSDSSDPTGVNGAIYYNAAIHEFRCYRDSNWESCSTNPIDRGWSVEDEFLGGDTSTANAGNIGALGWTNANIGGATNAKGYNTGISPTADHPGIFRMMPNAGGTLAASNGYTIGLWNQANGNSAAPWVLAAGNVFKASAAIGSATTGKNTMRVGIHDEAGSIVAPATGVFWEADPTVSANWRYCYNNTATPTCASSGVAIVANRLVQLEIRITAMGSGTSAATFSITDNGTTTTNTVSATTINTTNLTSPAITCYAQDANAENCYVDYVQVRGTASAKR